MSLHPSVSPVPLSQRVLVTCARSRVQHCLLSLERELPEGRALPLLFSVDSSAPCAVPGTQQVFGRISRNAFELEVVTGWKFVLVNNQGPFSYQLPLVPESPLSFCPISFHFC